MGARNGAQFLDGLRARRREVWVGDERVDDVTEHPAFAGAARSVAEVFDRQLAFPDDCLMVDEATGDQVNVSHMLPRSRDDLWRRGRGLERIAEATCGLMGRTPDYMNVTFAGFAGEPRPWSGPEGSNAQGYGNLVAFQRRIALDDVSLTHTIVHPTIDRATDHLFGQNPVPLRKVGETPTGIVVRGARILATLAPFADELAVYPGSPLPPDAPPEFALSFTVPMDAPGLVFLCRDSAALTADPFDAPLSSRFDEQDAYVIFDDVEIPHESVFIDSRPDVYNAVMALTNWWPNIMQQTTTRAVTKLEFAYGIASRLAEAVNDTQPSTADMLGEIHSYLEVARSALLLSIEHAHDAGDGIWFPDARALHPMRSLLATWFPRVNEIITIIGSHNLLAAPSKAMLDDPRLAGLVEEFLPGANGLDGRARSAIHRLAWDFVGSRLGVRNDLYERNYLGSARSSRIREHQVYADRTRAYRLVDEMLHRTTA